MIRATTHFCWVALYWTGIVILGGAAIIVLLLRHWAMPQLPQYRADIEAAVEKALRSDVSIGGAETTWHGLYPVLRLRQVALNDAAGQPALSLPSVEVALSWWTLLSGQPKLHRVHLDSPTLTLRRDAAGTLRLGELALNAPGDPAGDPGPVLDWLLAQPHLSIRNARLAWQDALAPESAFTLDRLNLDVDRHWGRHRASLQADPETALASRLDLRADLLLVKANRGLQASGKVYAQTARLDLGESRRRLARWLPAHAKAGPEAGLLAARAWIDLEVNRPIGATVDLRAVDAVVRTGEAAAVTFRRLSGRLSYGEDPTGLRFEARQLTFETRDIPMRAPADLTLRLGYLGQTKDVGQIALTARQVDLGVMTTLAEQLPIDRAFKAQLGRFAPRGELREADVRWQRAAPLAPASVAFKVSAHGLAINPVDALPGVSGLTGRASGSDLGGEISIDSRALTFSVPQLIESPLRFDRAEAQLRWSRARPGDALEVAMQRVRLDSPALLLEASGKYRSLPQSRDRSPGHLDLKGRVLRADATQIETFLPRSINPVREWLKGAVRAGRVETAEVLLNGDLWHFPFADPRHGVFKVDARLTDVRLKFLPDWPIVEDVRAGFSFHNAAIMVKADSARIFESAWGGLTASIPSLVAEPPVLAIRGTATTSAQDVYRLLRESPLAEGPGGVTRVLSLSGKGQLDLSLQVPLVAKGIADAVKVNGRYRFLDSTAAVSQALTLRRVEGELTFSERGVNAPLITGQMFGLPATVRLSTNDARVVEANIEGRARTGDLDFLLSPALLKPLSGEAAWRARLTTGSEGTQLRIESQLVGVRSEFPAPLAKTATESLPLRIDFARLGQSDEEIRISVADRMRAALYRDFPAAQQPVVKSAMVRLGSGSLESLARPLTGLWISGNLPFLDYDRWREITRTPEGGSTASNPNAEAGLELKGVDLALGRIRAFGYEYPALSTRLTREEQVWTGKISAPDIDGTLTWDGLAAGGRGALTARLSRFHLLPATADAPARIEDAVASGDPLPALDIVAESFRLKQQWLGKLELSARPSGSEWLIERLRLATGHASVNASGGWRQTAGGPITRLALNAESGNLNATFAQFGHGDTLKRGTGTLKGTLLWPGAPHDFSLQALSGEIKVDWREGQFAKMEPGLGKLLGLISLQSIPRRITLDFRDVFSDGFAFDRISGDIRIARGILLTDNFEVSGPAAFVAMSGEVSLSQETQNLRLRVVPEVGEGVALAASVIGTPVLGLTTLLVQKLLQNPLNRIVAFEYQVTGTWDNAVVSRAGAANAPAGATAASQ
jgi:uncharacterized protein (TIGR02099 family)